MTSFRLPSPAEVVAEHLHRSLRMAREFMAPNTEFSLADLRESLECIWDVKLDPANFQRQRKDSKYIEFTGKTALQPRGGRPARLYRFTKEV